MGFYFVKTEPGITPTPEDVPIEGSSKNLNDAGFGANTVKGPTGSSSFRKVLKDTGELKGGKEGTEKVLATNTKVDSVVMWTERSICKTTHSLGMRMNTYKSQAQFLNPAIQIDLFCGGGRLLDREVTYLGI